MPLMMLSALVGKFGDRVYEFVPFFLLAKNGGKVEFKLNLNKILEGVVIAIVTGMIVGWFVKGDIEYMKADIADVKAQVGQIHRDIYRPEIGVRP